MHRRAHPKTPHRYSVPSDFLGGRRTSQQRVSQTSKVQTSAIRLSIPRSQGAHGGDLGLISRVRFLGSGLAFAILGVPRLIELVEFVAPAQWLKAGLLALKG
jgi:hypothetical protein